MYIEMQTFGMYAKIGERYIMKHYMKLWQRPFEMIRSGEKTIELRLYDEKRRQVKVNDEIVFTCPTNNETPITVRVIALHCFNSFDKLYASLPLTKCGYTDETVAEASARDMDSYYSADEQTRYGVVGIEIERID